MVFEKFDEERGRVENVVLSTSPGPPLSSSNDFMHQGHCDPPAGGEAIVYNQKKRFSVAT
jgi:hypothetical protein